MKAWLRRFKTLFCTVSGDWAPCQGGDKARFHDAQQHGVLASALAAAPPVRSHALAPPDPAPGTAHSHQTNSHPPPAAPPALPSPHGSPAPPHSSAWAPPPRSQRCARRHLSWAGRRVWCGRVGARRRARTRRSGRGGLSTARPAVAQAAARSRQRRIRAGTKSRRISRRQPTAAVEVATTSR